MRTLLLLLLLCIGFSAGAQNEALAKNYMEQGEYEKALTIFQKLYDKTPARYNYFMALVEANQQLERFDEAERLLTEKLRERRVSPQLLVEFGYNYSLQNKEIEANQKYAQAIDYITENPNYSYVVGRAFENYGLLNEAVLVYEKAMELDPTKDFNLQLARIYGEQGQLDKMFGKYIDLIEAAPENLSVAQRNFSQYVTDDAANEANGILRKNLLKRSQESPNLLYNELLSWLFIQQKEFKKAFTQEKAIYKRTGEDLRGLVELTLITIEEEAFEEASEIVSFLIESSSTAEGKLRGYQYLMKIRLQTATEKEYASIDKEFQELFKQYGTGIPTYLLQIDYNHFLAFQVGKKEIAIENLKALTKIQLSAFQEARVKMELADILVVDEKFNQALIYYSQIQKKVQSDVLAQEARFKVARTSYYKGDFEWAQTQLDVLRKSASQLIANDAMQLSLMIRDNSLEDSTQTALKKFARADLYAFQNRTSEAISLLDDILVQHKGEKIEDEALLKQGKLFEKTNQYEKAEENYLKLIEFYKDDILGDDAHYLLAKLYEEKFQNPEKAKELYEQIVFNFEDSIYFIEARKKFRMLRGDAIN
ncbi:tetratricopeptide repeat protein [Cochleicola gelatinilyticus]|uniref:Tetratricopeptide repeat-like domain-containing protein n=1 Tax=Cochleicola gelatinilyticus TaxID=1763537 RepID=A0A167J8X6_9FLAO|nr:tetratricopeptide repeat protein [Cochleicola gelatinilyticus]OAB80438.1 hypothetical protein ULVI_06795 [Cochleicola gelatinilyticus]